MTARELLATLERSGVAVSVAGDRLHVEAPAGAVTEDLRRLLREHEPELIAALTREPAWPPESLEAERRFGHRTARLYPFLGRSVNTPHGRGRLLQVFPDRVAVLPDRNPTRTAYFLASEVTPPETEALPPWQAERIH